MDDIFAHGFMSGLFASYGLMLLGRSEHRNDDKWANLGKAALCFAGLCLFWLIGHNQQG